MACRGGKDEIGPDRGSHKTEAVKSKIFLWGLEHPGGRGGKARQEREDNLQGASASRLHLWGFGS